MTRTLTTGRALRIALTAQGLAVARPDNVTMRQVQGQIDRLALLQIDSINVVARAHYLPLFSRLGEYDPRLLDRAAHRSPRRLFEYWGHAASLIDVRLYPALRFRMAAADQEAWGGMRRVQQSHPHLVEELRHVVAEHGPVTARQAEAIVFAETPAREREHWGWNWSVVKQALEYLFWAGEISSAHRNAQFERAYLPTAEVVGPALAAAPTLSTDEARTELCRRTIRALGVGTTGCVADYFRISKASAAAALTRLSAAGEVEPVVVGPDRVPAWLDVTAKASTPRPGGTLFSPFDSMVFERARLKWLFDFDYRIEIYVPEAKRRYGYYVYPFLYHDRFVGRVDLRADRASGVLQVKGRWFEPGADAPAAREALDEELHRLADWQGLDAVVEVRR
ncbi:winged helix-turn-helix domain-containing protein [Enemella sp. A6]|uniref:winged helix-turn-helix domain-containing protein n=1 Tax=Enemella sp. A6 TaxID=3440152 RepID=UPI003EBD1B6C